MKEIRESGRILTVNRHEEVCTVIKYTEFIDGEKGLSFFEEQGRKCNFIDEDTFEVVVTGEILRRAD